MSRNSGKNRESGGGGERVLAAAFIILFYILQDKELSKNIIDDREISRRESSAQDLQDEFSDLLMFVVLIS
ncbi:hypothetical protein HAX54_023740 [Datura stramonium]|uniref:Uncharacterized protein n=1 Tax=Datura stramonium TaxID=4076 RepID=A0ABS8UYU5_DATST|nr:hypothetical protein [Datura stramonium]